MPLKHNKLNKIYSLFLYSALVLFSYQQPLYADVLTSVNDWAKAWAVDNNNLPLFPVVPGGERQRELSYRFGINIAMYALTGNYKSDQIHSKSILNRLSKSN